MKQIHIIVAVSIAVVLSGCGRGRSAPADAAGHVKRGVELAESGNPAGALASLHQFIVAADMNPESVADSIRIDAYMLLGDLYCDFDDYASGVSYYERARGLMGADAGRDLLVRLHHRLAVCYSNLGERADARSNYGAFLSKSEGRPDYDFEQALTAGYIEKAFGSEAMSKTLMKRALALVDERGLDTMLRELPSKELMEIYNRENKPDSALMLLKNLYPIAEAKGSDARKAGCMRAAMRAWMLKGELDSSLVYQQRYFEFKYNMFDSEAFTALSDSFRYEDEARTRRRLEALRDSVSLGQFSLVAVGLVLAGCLLFIWYRRREMQSRRRYYLLDAAMHRLQKRVGSAPAVYAESAEPVSGAAATSDPARRELFARISGVVSRPEIFTDPTFSLPRLAEMMGTNTKYVSAAIKEATGHNFRSYVNEYRIREARSRLLDTDNYGRLTIQSVAESVGFVAPSAFISAFKQFTGMTPSYYLKMSREMSD